MSFGNKQLIHAVKIVCLKNFLTCFVLKLDRKTKKHLLLLLEEKQYTTKLEIAKNCLFWPNLLMLLILECSNNNNSCWKSYEENKNENSQKLFVLAKFVDVINPKGWLIFSVC